MHQIAASCHLCSVRWIAESCYRIDPALAHSKSFDLWCTSLAVGFSQSPLSGLRQAARHSHLFLPFLGYLTCLRPHFRFPVSAHENATISDVFALRIVNAGRPRDAGMRTLLPRLPQKTHARSVCVMAQQHLLFARHGWLKNGSTSSSRILRFPGELLLRS